MDASTGGAGEPEVETLRYRTGKVCGDEFHARVHLGEFGERSIPEGVEVGGAGVAPGVARQLRQG